MINMYIYTYTSCIILYILYSILYIIYYILYIIYYLLFIIYYILYNILIHIRKENSINLRLRSCFFVLTQLQVVPRTRSWASHEMSKNDCKALMHGPSRGWRRNPRKRVFVIGIPPFMIGINPIISDNIHFLMSPQ